MQAVRRMLSFGHETLLSKMPASLIAVFGCRFGRDSDACSGLREFEGRKNDDAEKRPVEF